MSGTGSAKRWRAPTAWAGWITSARATKSAGCTRTLFRYRGRLLDALNPALEPERSFVRAEYQRSYSPLLLLRKGIGQFVTRNPHYRVLFGPDSISKDYRELSRRLLVDYLTNPNLYQELACLVRPRRPFRPASGLADFPDSLAKLSDLERISELIGLIESDDKGVPVLLKQYLKLDGRLLAFNLDPEFNDSLDGLLMVDLSATDPRVLRGYMGRQQANSYLRMHEAIDPARRSSEG